MAHPNIDLYRVLVHMGADETDAKAAAQFQLDDLVTNAGLQVTIMATKADIQATRADINELRLTTKADIALVRADLAGMKSGLIQWMVGIVFTAMAIQTALILAL